MVWWSSSKKSAAAASPDLPSTSPPAAADEEETVDEINEEAEEDSSDTAFLQEEARPDDERVCSIICVRKAGMFHLCDVTYDGRKLRWLAGPHWKMLAVTYIYLLVMTGLVFGLVATYGSYAIIFSVGISFTVLTLIFLTLAAFRDPGIFPKHTRPLARDWSYSNQAGSFRPPEVIFCRQCKLLIEDCEFPDGRCSRSCLASASHSKHSTNHAIL